MNMFSLVGVKFSKKKTVHVFGACWGCPVWVNDETYSALLNHTLCFFSYICKKKKEWKT